MPILPWQLLGGHRAGETIYAHSDLLEDFCARKLHRIRAPFVLVSGDGDRNVGPPEFAEAVTSAIAAHPMLRAWFVQNLAMAHPKARPLPIGLDYHTLALGRLPRWGTKASPLEQEARLDQIRLDGPPLAQRDLRGFCNWHLNPTHPVRKELPNRLEPRAVFFQEEALPRAESWTLNAQFAATISPSGQGLDCHRSWEALVLGAFPVIQSGPYARVFAGLPVLEVPDLGAVTTSELAAARDRILATDYDFAPLLLAYWQDQFAGRTPSQLRMSYQTFCRTPLSALRAAYRGA